MKNRRQILKIFSALGLYGTMPVMAQMHQPAQTPATPANLVTIAAKATPWDSGNCAFCGMPLKTPDTWNGRAFSKGFFERTASQIARAEPQESLHFESIACMINYAYAHGLKDGVDTTFYVTDHGVYDPAKGAASVTWVAARQARFLWAEKPGWVVMDAKLVAFKDADTGMAFAKANPELGRTRMFDFQTLLDLAPLPEMNLIPLLAKHTGLIK